MLLPQPFINNITHAFGDHGRDWLIRLPVLIENSCTRWSVTLNGAFPLSYNFVAPGVRSDGSTVVLKIGVPHPEVLSEMEALRCFAGHGAVNLLESDPAHCIMLLERVIPGDMLSDLADDDQATHLLAQAMTRLWRPLTPTQAQPFHNLHRWTRAFDHYRQTYPMDGPFPPAIFDRAEGLRRELLASQGETVLLHGDLHHDNLLRATREPWLVIDPKGLAGEREAEVGPLFYNPWQRVLDMPDLATVTTRRLDILTEVLSLDRQRLLSWAFVESVLSILWSVEDHTPDWDLILPIAAILNRLLTGQFL